MSQQHVHMTATAMRTPCLKSIRLVFFDPGLVSILAVICNHVTDLGARGILRRRQLQLGEARRFPKVNRGLVSLASFSLAAFAALAAFATFAEMVIRSVARRHPEITH